MKIGFDGKAIITDQDELEKCGGENICPLGAIEKIEKDSESEETQTQYSTPSKTTNKSVPAQGTDQSQNTETVRGKGRGRGRQENIGGGAGKRKAGSGRKTGGSKNAGPPEKCICPNCGNEEPHQPRQPCSQKKCPECGSFMMRG